jgi:anti-sigma28 factor (negative regulator of flagellin synthesis)
MGIPAALIGSAVIGGISSMASSSAQSDASQAATDATVQANQDNIAYQKWLYTDQKTQAAPWYNAGTDAVTQLQKAISDGTYNLDTSKLNQQTYNPETFTGNVDLTQDPSYQFRLGQGANALDMSAASKGMLMSGAQAKAITQYGQNFASQEYTNAYNRSLQTNQTNNTNALNATQVNNASNLNTWNALSGENTAEFNRLASVSGAGQTANNAISNAAQNMGTAVGQSTLNTGNALATNALNQGNATSNLYSNMATTANQGVQNYLMYSMLPKSSSTN